MFRRVCIVLSCVALLGCPDPEPDLTPPAPAPATPEESRTSPPIGRPEAVKTGEDVEAVEEVIRLQANTMDPVCNMQVEMTSSKTVVYGETTYHFCGDACARAFEESPKDFLREEGLNAPGEEK